MTTLIIDTEAEIRGKCRQVRAAYDGLSVIAETPGISPEELVDRVEFDKTEPMCIFAQVLADFEARGYIKAYRDPTADTRQQSGVRYVITDEGRNMAEHYRTYLAQRDTLTIEVLKMVDRTAPCHKSDVMRAFGHHEKTIFNILNELLEDGLIEFSPADEYGSRFLGLTDEGRKTLDTKVRVRIASEESR